MILSTKVSFKPFIWYKYNIIPESVNILWSTLVTIMEDLDNYVNFYALKNWATNVEL